MIKSILLVVSLSFVFSDSFSQTNFYNNGQEITILKKTSLTVKGDLVNEKKGSKEGEIANGGEIRLEKNLINNTTNNFFITNAGSVEFYGDSLQEIISDSTIYFHTLEVNKPKGELQLQTNIRLLDSLILTKGNLHMNSFDIQLLFTGILYGETNEKRLYGDLSYVYAQRSLTGNKYNIAGLGLSIESTNSLGTTNITRAHDAQGGASNGSIKRYFRLEPNNSDQVLDKVMMTYLDTNEVGNLEEGKFSLWTSYNDGLVWFRQTSTPLAGADSVIAENVSFTGNEILVTLAESECDSLPQVNLGADTMYLCQGDTITIDAKNEGLFFKWNTGATSQKIKTTTAGSYAAVVTDANGCVGVDTTEVILKPYPDASFTVANVCQNFTSTFTNNSTISADSVAYFWGFGDSKLLSDTSNEFSPIFVYDTAGTYPVKLTVTSDFGCIDSVKFNHIVQPNPVANFSVNSVCLDSTTSFTNTTTIASGGINTRHWDFGDLLILSDTSIQTNPSFIYDTSGSYITQLIVTSNAGCTDTIEKPVTVHPRPVPDFSFVSAGENESIQLQNLSSINSGTINYQWNFGDGVTTTVASPSKSYSAFGNYPILLEATSAFDCWDTLSQIITIADIPQALFVLHDTCATSTVNLENQSSVSGGSSLSYLWKFGDGTTSTDVTPIKNYIKSGTYTIWLVATSTENKKDSTSQQITIHPNPVTGFNFTNKCAEERVSFTNQSFITTGFNQYLWRFGDVTTSNFGSPTKVYDTDGDYTVQLIATSNFGCKDTLEKVITINPLPVLDFGNTITTCGDSIVLDAENLGSSYLWNTSSDKQIIVAKTSGKYSVTVTSPKQCKLTTSVDISLNSLFTPNLGDDRKACVSTILDAGNPGSSYLWNTGEDDRLITVTESGTYSVDIIDQNNCVGADTIEIIINQNPIVDLGNDTTVCSGDDILLDAGNAGASYKWSTGATTPTIFVNQSSTYSVVVTDANTCSSSSNITLGIFSLPVVRLGNDKAVCATTTLRAGNDGASYLWSDGSTGDTLFVQNAGTYTLEVTNGNTCKNSDTIQVSILPKPVVELGDNQTICNNETVVLNAGTDGNDYRWNTGAISQLLFARATGTYSVTVTNSDNCSSSDAVKVTVLDQVEVNIGQDFTLCAGKSVTLDAENSGSSYSWGTTADTSFGPNQTIVANQAGNYWVEVKTEAGCIGSDTIKIGATSNFVEAQFLSVSLINVGDTIQFLELSTPDSLNYLWDFDDGVISLEQDPMHTYFIAGNYEVSLTVSNELCSDQVIKEIIVRELREVIIEPETAIFFEVIDFSVYPNPFTEYDEVNYLLEFNQSAKANLVLYDLSGRMVFNFEIEGKKIEQLLPVDYLNSGMYILKLIVKNQSQSLRLEKL